MSHDLRRLPRNMVKNTMKILSHEDAIHKLDPDHWLVISLRTPSRRVRVYRINDVIKCRVDPRNSEDQPCSHILSVMIYEGLVELPNTAANVWTKGKDGRDHVLEERAWRQVPIKVPEYLARLLTEGLPLLGPPPKVYTRGRPWTPLYPQVYQAIVRVAQRQNLRATEGAMNSLEHRHHNPYGPVSRTTLARFLSNPESTEILEKLLALTTWPARSYETIVHPDGTGLTEQHFTAYFEEKYKKKAERRQHSWNFAIILWTYRYTMIAAIHSKQGPFGEAPWLLPLLERAGLTLDLRELGGDKAYVANYIFEYARQKDIDVQIKLKRNANPVRSSVKNKAFKRVVEEARLDPEGYRAKSNRRSNAESGNHAFKAYLGDQVYSKNPVSQRNEVLCMAIAYNLARLVYLSLAEGVEIRFQRGAEVLAQAPWVSLEELHRTMTVQRSKTRRLASGTSTT